MSRAQGWLRVTPPTVLATVIGALLSSSVAAQAVDTITTVAGGGPGTMPAVEASLRGNSKVVADGSGNLYVSDGAAHRVFRFERQSGMLSPFAGTGFRGSSGDGGAALQAQLDTPYALALDEGNGTLYVQDNGVIRAMSVASGTISGFAGGGSLSPADGLLATQAFFASIGDVAVAQGIVYVADASGARIWAIENGALRAVAGNGVARGALDGPGGNLADDYFDGVAATDASLGTVSAVAVSGQSLYFYEGATLASGGARYRRVDLSTGTLTTYAGNGYSYGFFDGPGGDPRDDVVENVPALQAALGQTTALVVDPVNGDLYGLIRDRGLVRRVSANGDGTAGTIATVFGGGAVPPTYVAPTAARLLNPTGLARDGDGALYVADRVDFEAYTVYESDGSFAFPVVGNGYSGYCGDGGPAAAACLFAPTSARPDGAGQLWIADDGNRVIRLVGPSATISSLMPQGRMLASATDLWPLGGGKFLFSSPARHTVFSVEAPYESGMTFAGTGVPTGSEDGEGGDPEDDLNDGELAWVASLKSPAGLARDAAGNTFIADSGNHRVRRVDGVNSLISTVAGTGAPGLDDSQGQPATATAFFTPHALAFEANGDLLVAERDGHRVRRVRAGADGLVTGAPDETVALLAGAGPSDEKGFAGDGGPAIGALLDTPTGLAVDVLGHIYVADSGNHAIRRVHAQSGIVDTIAGRGDGGDDVPAAQSGLEQIGGLSADVVNGRSCLYVTDTGQNRIRRIDLGPAVDAVNQPPVIEIMTNDGAVVTATSPDGVMFGLYVLASDPDGDPLTLTWSGPFGTAYGLGAAVRLPIGVSTVTVDIDDGHGHVVTGTATITVSGENTFVGSGEVVTPTDDHTRRSVGETEGRVSVTFLGPVTAPGLTWLRTRTDQSPPPPPGKQLGSAPLYYGIGTTAVGTGNVRICLDLTGMSFAFPAQVELHRLGAGWSGLGLSPNPVTHEVCFQAPFEQVFGTYANFTPADPDSIVETIAGTGAAEDSGDDGPATLASLNVPGGLALDRARNLLYIAQGSHRVRRVTLGTGQIETIAGTGSLEPGPVDGVDARLSSIGSPDGLALDADGNLFVGDKSHCLIRRIDVQTNVITTVAGSWRGPGLTCGHTGDGGTAREARIGFPHRLAFDTLGNLFFVEQPTLSGENGGYVRRIAAGADGRITGDDSEETILTVAGNGQQSGSIPGVTPLSAGIYPWDLAAGPGDGLYVADNGGVWRLSPGADGKVDGSADETLSRIFGTPVGYNLPFQGDGGPARNAYSAHASGLAVLPSGDVIVSDPTLRRFRRISAGADGVVDGSPDESVVTVAGFSDDADTPAFNGDGYALTTVFAWPVAAVHDGVQAIYVSDPVFHRVRRVGVASGGGGGTPAADVSIAASAAPDPVDAGSVLSYTVTVANLGPSSAHDVRVSLPVAATTAFVGPAGSCTGPAASSAGTITCGLGDLAAGQSAPVTIQIRPSAAGPLAVTLTASANDTDPNIANNSATVSVVVSMGPVVLDVEETIVVTDAPTLTPSVMLEVPETIVVTDAPATTPSVMLEVPETIVVSDSPSVSDATPPSVTVNQAAGQPDPTSSSSIEFAVQFGEPVTGFEASDVSFAGSTVGGSLTTVVTGAGASYIVSVTGMSGAGTVVVSIPAGAAVDADGNASQASTSMDNVVTVVLAAVPTATSLVSSRNPSLTTAPPIFTATVASEQPGLPPTGQVEFISDGVVFGRSPLFERGGLFVAVLGGAHLAVAGSPHTITARYLGDAVHLASDSAPVAQAVHEGTYYVENLSGLPARLVPVAFNDAGQIAGNLTTSAGLNGVLFDPLQGYRRLDAGSDFSEAFDLNAAGTVVGRSGADAATTVGFADRNGVLEQIPASLSGVGVNGREQIAINLENGNGAAIYQGGALTPLDQFEARAINDGGMVAGAVAGIDGQPEAVLWEAGALLGLGRFGQSFASASRVNNAGTVLVQTGELSGDESAFLYRDGVPTPLGTGRAWDVNDADVVVAGTDEARVYLGDASIRLAIGPIAGMAVNNRAEIVGSVANQLKRWTPVPTSALLVGSVTGFEDDEATLTATLTSQGAPVSGQPIAFSLNGRAAGSATTGPDGVAVLNGVSLGGLPIGVTPDGVLASFAGSRALGASSATASLAIQAVNPADVGVLASVMPSTTPIRVGSNVTYSVFMTNNGPSAATELRLNVTLPAGLQFVSDTGQGACSWSPGLGTCDFGSLAVGATRTITVVARPLTSGPLTAIFGVSTPRFDPVPLNNTRFVTIDPVPTVTINQAPGQPDPTSASPIRFSVAFSEPVTGFGPSDVSFIGSLAGGGLTAAVSGSGADYTVAVTGMSVVGLVAVSIPAGAAVDSGGNASLASTSTDRTVLYQPNTTFGFVSPSNGGNVVFAIVNPGGQPSGVLSYSRGSASYTATRITSFVISGQTASFEGWSSDGRLFVATAFDGAPGQPDRFHLWIEGVRQTPLSGALASGTLVVQPWAADTRLKGWVDLHTHPMSNIAFGGKLFHGAPAVDSLMPAVQMPGGPCRIDERARSIDEALANDSFTRGVASCGGNVLRAPMIQAIELINGAQSAPAGAVGYPSFTDWPRWNDITHQKMWVDWIRRAWQYGQRVMVALSHNNRTLADLMVMGGGPITGVTDDEASSALQVDEIKKLVAGHASFMAVARTPDELRSIVESNRMAIVLGVELDNLGNLNDSPSVTTADVDRKIQELFDADVRYVLPVHFTDNVFGDAALHEDLYNVLNLRETGDFFRVGCAQVADEVGYQASGIPAVLNLFLPPGTPPVNPPACRLGPPGPTQFTGHVNVNLRSTTGLTPLGEFAIRAMMRRGMFVDIDHMSDRAANRTLALATAVPNGGYPLMSGHTGVRSRTSPSFNAENSRTTLQLARIACLGGMFGLGTGEKSGTRTVDWTAHYSRAYEIMRRAFAPNGQCPQGTPLGAGFIGLGTDANSLVKTPRSTIFDPIAPRFTDIYNPGNPLNAGVSPLVQSTTGSKTWDYNLDGVAHYGMFADFLRDVRTLPASATMTGRQIVDDQMMYGADYFYRAWLKADSQKARVVP